jgi:hypothetical protein
MNRTLSCRVWRKRNSIERLEAKTVLSATDHNASMRGCNFLSASWRFSDESTGLAMRSKPTSAAARTTGSTTFAGKLFVHVTGKLGKKRDSDNHLKLIRA